MAALGLSCDMWDLAPSPGFKPRPPALWVWSLSHWAIREVPESFLTEKLSQFTKQRNTVKKLTWRINSIYLFIYFLAALLSMWDLSSPTRDGTCAPLQWKQRILTTGLPAAAAAKSLQSCPTLCDPIDGSPPGPAVPGILQARTLEWVAISSSNAWKWKVKVKSLSRVWLLATPWTAAYQAPLSMGFSRQEYWSGVPLPGMSLNRCNLKQ